MREVGRGLTVTDVARRYRVGEDKVRRWIRAGELTAVNTAERAGDRPRWVVPPDALAAFELRRTGHKEAPRPARRRFTAVVEDFYPG